MLAKTLRSWHGSRMKKLIHIILSAPDARIVLHFYLGVAAALALGWYLS